MRAPERGALIWLTFTPQSGREQGVVLADQLRSLDWRSRQADIIGTAPRAVLERVLQLVGTLLSSP